MGGSGIMGGPQGDLYIITKVRPHPYFERKGDNLYSEAAVTFREAALGDKIEIPTKDGMVALTIPPGTQSGQQLKLRGKGVPHLGGRGEGDHYVTVRVVTPEKLDERGRTCCASWIGLPRRTRGRMLPFGGSGNGNVERADRVGVNKKRQHGCLGPKGTDYGSTGTQTLHDQRGFGDAGGASADAENI